MFQLNFAVIGRKAGPVVNFCSQLCLSGDKLRNDSPEWQNGHLVYRKEAPLVHREYKNTIIQLCVSLHVFESPSKIKKEDRIHDAFLIIVDTPDHLEKGWINDLKEMKIDANAIVDYKHVPGKYLGNEVLDQELTIDCFNHDDKGAHIDAIGNVLCSFGLHGFDIADQTSN